MLVRLVADREPYLSYRRNQKADEGDPAGSLSFSTDGERREPELEIIPAELFLANADSRRFAVPVFAYGPAALLAACFEAGCSDYLRDPWSLAELATRAHRFGKLRFDTGGLSLEMGGSTLSIVGPSGRSILLNERERRLLKVLVENSGAVVTRSAIARVLRKAYRPESRWVDVLVARLRSRLELLEVGLGHTIRASRGLGYRISLDACGQTVDPLGTERLRNRNII